jgi:uncharacterized damage-inducible protein DinB
MSSPHVILIDQLKFGIEYVENLVGEIQDTDLFEYQPNPSSRTTGQILMHIIRSFEYYITGVSTDIWKPLDYSTERYDDLTKIAELIQDVKGRLFPQIDQLDGDRLHHYFDHLDRPSFGLNLLIELLYHQSEHIGQLQVYLRCNNLQPPAYPFLI